jgi:hypothetical protein
MYLTAQRPAADVAHPLGINAYYYMHNLRWAGHVPRALPQPRFVRGHESVPKVQGQARRIRSYLDIFAPDDAVVEEVQRSVYHLDRNILSDGGHSPWVHVCGRVTVEFDIEAGLANVWRAELFWLSGEARRVWQEPGYRTM